MKVAPWAAQAAMAAMKKDVNANGLTKRHNRDRLSLSR